MTQPRDAAASWLLARRASSCAAPAPVPNTVRSSCRQGGGYGVRENRPGRARRAGEQADEQLNREAVGDQATFRRTRDAGKDPILSLSLTKSGRALVPLGSSWVQRERIDWFGRHPDGTGIQGSLSRSCLMELCRVTYQSAMSRLLCWFWGVVSGSVGRRLGGDGGVCLRLDITNSGLSF